MAADSSDVSTLEHEVEEARERLASTIARLTDPATQQAMKNEVMEYVQGYKDQLLDGARASANEKTSGIAADLKQRAMNNPLGIAMIGAGLAYRLYRHPPLATLLIGGGIALLARGGGRKSSDPTSYRAPYDRDQPRGYVPGGVAGYGYPVEEDAPGSTTTDRMMQAASQAGEKAREAGLRVRDAASEAGSRIAETAGRAREAAYDMAERTREAAHDAYERTRSTAQGAYERTRSAAEDTLERTRAVAQDTVERTRAAAQDTYERTADRLGGVAHDARERAGDAYESVRTSPLALGAVGVVAGAAIGHALRSSETGERFVRGASDYATRGARGLGSSARYAGRRAADSASDLASSVSSAASELAEGFSGGDEGERGPRRGSGQRSQRGGPNRSREGQRRRGGDDRDMMSSVAETASAAYRSAAEQASYAGRRGADLGRQAADQIGELAHNYPLLLGAIGVALGAAAGLAMRPTESEDELMGSYSDALKSRAREMASAQYEEALGAANELAEGLGKPGNGQAQYGAADWETVIGGGAPPVQGAPTPGPGVGSSRG